jgi:hypothetical protein
LLHACGEMGRLTNGRVVHVQVAPDGADDHLSRVETNADLNEDPFSLPHTVGVPFHRFLHPEGGIARADCVILVGHGCPEQRHNPVAHHLVDGAFVVMDGLHHPLQDRVEDLARLLGITVGEEFHRALQVGEENGDLFALSLQRRFGRQDLLGEVLGRVAVRRSRRRPRTDGNGMSADVAELGRGREGRPAIRAGPGQRSRAFLAEPRRLQVVVLAPGTLHAALRRPGPVMVRTVGRA